jgi:hypothetical protein
VRGPYTPNVTVSYMPPADLRPAQLGIVLLGRVILGHIAAMLVDLAQRGFILIEEIPGVDDRDWLAGRPVRRAIPGQAGRAWPGSDPSPQPDEITALP